MPMRPFRPVLAALVALSVPAAAPASSMSDGAILSDLIGKRIEATYYGAPRTVLFDEAGLVRITDDDGVANGTWTLTNGNFCMTLVDGPNPGQSCMTFTAHGGGVYSSSTGLSLVVVTR